MDHSTATAYAMQVFAGKESIDILYTEDGEDGAVEVFFARECGTYQMTVWNEPGIGVYGEW